MGKRDRERRARIQKGEEKPIAPPHTGTPNTPLVVGHRIAHDFLTMFGIPHFWAMRRPLPPEEKGEQDAKAGSDVEA